MKSKEVEYNGQKVTIHEGEAAIVNQWGGLRTVPVSYLKDPQFLVNVRTIEDKINPSIPEDGLDQKNVSELRELLMNYQVAMPMSASKEALIQTLRDEVTRRTPSITTKEDRETKSSVSAWHDLKAKAKMLAEQNGVELPKKQDKETLEKFIAKLNK